MSASVIARSDAPPVFQLSKQVFDFVSGFVRGLAVFDCFFSIFLWRNTGCDLLLCKHIADFVAVVSTIPNKGFDLGQVFQQNIGAFEVATLTFRQVQADRSPEVVTQGVQFGIQTAFCAPDQPWLAAPFFRLEAVRWAFRCVASIIRTFPASSCGLASSSKMRSNKPFTDHRLNRL